MELVSSKKMYAVVGSWCNGYEDKEWLVAIHEDADVAEFYAILAEEEERRLDQEDVYDPKNKYDPDRHYAGDPYTSYHVSEIPIIDQEVLYNYA